MKTLRTNDDASCAEARQRLSMRHDGMLADGDPALARHVAACAACAHFERELGALTPLFDALRAVEPPPRLLASLTAQAPSKRAVTLRQFAVRAAAALLGFVGVSALARLADAPTAVRTPKTLALLERVGRTLHPDAELETLPERELLSHFSSGKVTR